jgi:C4-dicarboxylate-specific signal transduction histidine kinase
MTTSFRSRLWLIVLAVSLALLPVIFYLFIVGRLPGSTTIATVLVAYYGFILHQGLVAFRNFKSLVQSKEIITERNQQLQNFIDEIPGGFVCFDDKNHILFNNRAFVEMTDDKESEITKRVYGAIDTFKGSGAHSDTMRSEFGDGTDFRSIEVTLKQYGDVGHSYSLALVLERTRQAVLEKSLETERMANIQSARLASLGEMAGSVAHEINNPLAIISGRAMQAQRLLAELTPRTGPDGEVKKKQIEGILTNIDKNAGRIVGALRAFARDGELDNLEDRPIEGLITDALLLISERIRREGFEVTQQFSKNPVYVRCQPQEMIQVLVALFNNAIDAGHDCSQKIFDIATSASKQGEVTITITDLGVGVRDPDRLFTAFYTTKKQGEGSGLSLSTAYGVVRRHGGNLRLLRSQNPTVFALTIPKA